MNETKERILTEAMQLSAIDRQDLAERLILSVAETDQTPLESIDPDILEAWRQEIRRRMESYRRGESGASSLTDVFPELSADVAT